MKTKRCNMCGRKLTNPESILRGIGPVCYKKYVRGHRPMKKTTTLSTAAHQQTLL
ncbi:MAG: hypothetical protein HXS48_19635 [Theionarchaea archaeon]|nr:hypothetical protein [Theionarchaea archaeon]